MTEQLFEGIGSKTIESNKKVEGTINWSDKTILIAEDEEVNYVYLKTALLKTSVNVLRAYNGQEAVDIARVTPNIDLILMDIKMPKMNGIEATRAIKTFRNDITIIAQTAFAMEEDRQNCFAVGVDDFLAKPVRYKLLFDTLGKYLK
jgi:CheY-like chemotaxis protein